MPSGQHLTKAFPVLHHGEVPGFDPRTWSPRVFGLVDQSLKLTYDQVRALPSMVVVADIHCVTRWSKLDTKWEGVPFRDLLKLAIPRPEARYVLIHCEAGYTTSLPLEVLMDDDVLLAYRFDDADLTPEHGYPLRLVVPKKYFWKSAKWVRGLELLTEDCLGFWERLGYHNEADPWKEQRYS